MSAAGEYTTDTRRTPAAGGRWTGKRLVATVVVALLLVSLGYVIGIRSPWTAHRPDVVSGTAERVPANVPYAYFDPDDGDRVAFRLDDVVWRSDDRTDSGSVPPCLREAGRRIPVRVGLIEVTRPFGSGSYRKVLSVTCPGG